ncbi:MAG TPA: ABC transporter substrate binding protein [Myxococcales bacterium]|jgi:putative ABC transport system substrate-binding protein
MRSLPVVLSSFVTALAALAASWPASGRAEGEASLVVLSAENATYRALADGFSSTAGATTTLLVSAPAFAEQLAPALEKAKVVFAIGPEAARVVLEKRSAKPVLVAFAEGTASDSKTLVVPVLVPPEQQLAALKSTLPSVLDVPKQPRLGVLYDPKISSRLVGEYEAAAKAAGLSLVKAEVKQRSEVADAARELLDRVQALWLVPDATVVNLESFRTLVQLSLARKVPVIGFGEPMAKAGCVLAVQPEYAGLGKAVGTAARRLMEGKPATLPAPEGVIYLNAKAATLLGIELTEAARSKAAKIYD